ncbi:6-phosphofructokinase [Vulgatibacter incomptus]|uniref:ATP-dependent 6-phosphofructokinase n=1 Tax=Vulgatibacter incomptus TaxID=1391653 RepID=A0A0K1P8E0_9BACT|nr:ATP-dependent 6-phosphofructokinase [Vulgatibacter incomptus]AKU89762.1 6-phosphofructokinase [Vulgatibacter incomptus]
MSLVKVAVLTGGGDCPGLNAVIRAIVRRSEQRHLEVMGIRDGWEGLVEERHERLTRQRVSGILHLGGTILGTSRFNPFAIEDGPERVMRTLQRHNVGAVIAIGGDGTLSIAREMHALGVSIVGVPKTIDNDLGGTDYTFGFDTAVSIATEAIDRLHSTAEAHQRVIVVEVMGRHVGWIAAYAGLAGGADAILVPERPARIEEVIEHVERRRKEGRKFSIIVCAEGAMVDLGEGAKLISRGRDEWGHERLGGVAQSVAHAIEKRTGIETRVTVLGYVQRGGSPTASDRVLGTRYGVMAADLVASKRWGTMAALRGNEIVAVPLADATRSLKQLDPRIYDVASVFFG